MNNAEKFIQVVKEEVEQSDFFVNQPKEVVFKQITYDEGLDVSYGFKMSVNYQISMITIVIDWISLSLFGDEGEIGTSTYEKFQEVFDRNDPVLETLAEELNTLDNETIRDIFGDPIKQSHIPNLSML